jgi:hypothetical protein
LSALLAVCSCVPPLSSSDWVACVLTFLPPPEAREEMVNRSSVVCSDLKVQLCKPPHAGGVCSSWERGSSLLLTLAGTVVSLPFVFACARFRGTFAPEA